jgi:galactokinase
MKQRVFDAFRKEFGSAPTLQVKSPGRINLLGEHTDYNLGCVLPAAIDQAIYLAFGPREDRKLHFFAMDLNSRFETQLQGHSSKSELGWPNYILGVLQELKSVASFDIVGGAQGLNCAFVSDLPLGAGLSSSAALECGMALGLNELWRLGLSRPQLAQVAQAAENHFVGVQCGIMDQFANLLGEKDHVLKLDCRDLSYQSIRFQLNGNELWLLDTGVKHSLADGEYNSRRRACESVAAAGKKVFSGVGSLRDMEASMLERLKPQLSEDEYQCAHYVLGEMRRVEEFTQALGKGDLGAAGRLMYETHAGLKDLYRVSCDELDFLVEFSKAQGALGARMMGGGFGGCTINLLRPELSEHLIPKAKEAYRVQFGKELRAYPVSLEQGAQVIRV